MNDTSLICPSYQLSQGLATYKSSKVVSKPQTGLYFLALSQTWPRDSFMATLFLSFFEPLGPALWGPSLTFSPFGERLLLLSLRKTCSAQGWQPNLCLLGLQNFFVPVGMRREPWRPAPFGVTRCPRKVIRHGAEMQGWAKGGAQQADVPLSPPLNSMWGLGKGRRSVRHHLLGKLWMPDVIGSTLSGTTC